ncbi:MAG: class IV adenylate cyclase [Planctomycetes bacterium]|nr:class IV adenylate cyclase [Planctomycetota bacterium]
MPTELESKIHVESHEQAREKLRLGSATFIGSVLEINRILDRDDGELLKTGCGLRVRSITTQSGDTPKSTLTYKGVRIPGKFKQREELETQIDDADALVSILGALGYRPKIIFEKRRETWRLGPCNVELDELPKLGLFIEVEGPNEASIDEVLALLDLTGRTSMGESYVSLLMEGRMPEAGRHCEFRF